LFVAPAILFEGSGLEVPKILPNGVANLTMFLSTVKVIDDNLPL